MNKNKYYLPQVPTKGCLHVISGQRKKKRQKPVGTVYHKTLSLNRRRCWKPKYSKLLTVGHPDLFKWARASLGFLRSKFVFLSRGPSSRLLARVLRGIIWFIYISSMDMLLFFFSFFRGNEFLFLSLFNVGEKGNESIMCGPSCERDLRSV